MKAAAQMSENANSDDEAHIMKLAQVGEKQLTEMKALPTQDPAPIPPDQATVIANKEARPWPSLTTLLQTARLILR